MTTIVDMPYDHPDPVTSVDLHRQKVAAIETLAHAHVALYATIPPVPDPAAIAGLVAEGGCAFKISSFEAYPHRCPRIGADAVMVLFGALGRSLPVGLHNEDQDLIRATEARFKAEGRTRATDHSDARPAAAEMAATVGFLELAAAAGGHAHIVHISVPEGFDAVSAHRGGATAEMCAHYLVFDAADMERLGGKLKVNPPIRPGVRDALWDRLKASEFVSSDHSAWGLERKSSENIFEVAAGMPGLEVLLPAFFTEALRREGEAAALQMTARLLAEGPARFFGLTSKGRIAPGMDADLVVLAPGDWTYDARANPEGPGWSAYDGMTFAARPIETWVGGHLAFDGAAVTGARAGTYARRR